MRSRLVINCDNKRIQEHMAIVGTAIAKLNAMDFTVDHVEIDGYQRPVSGLTMTTAAVRNRSMVKPFAMVAVTTIKVITNGGRFR